MYAAKENKLAPTVRSSSKTGKGAAELANYISASQFPI
jgi:hypothetical protein